MSTEIYYFSGTGNSLFVAKEIQKRLPDAKLIPIVNLLKQDVIETNTDTVGFVFPLHGLTIPLPVKTFLNKLKLESSTYVFAIITRGGTESFAFPALNKILKRKGKNVDAFFILNVASNDPKFSVYEIPTREEFSLLETKVQKRLDGIKEKILHKEIIREEDTPVDTMRDHFSPPIAWFLERLVLLGMWLAEKTDVNDYFYSDAKCTGCGICEKVCLSGKIKMAGPKPAWLDQTKCLLCYTCLNYCPSQAIQIKTKWYMKSFTDKNGRYPHPFASVNEMIAQKTAGK